MNNMSKKITEKDLSVSVSQALNLEQKLVQKIIREYFKETSKYLKEEKMQAIPHLGTFKLRWHETYKSYNPKLKKEIEIPAHYGVRFHTALSLQKQLNPDISEESIDNQHEKIESNLTDDAFDKKTEKLIDKQGTSDQVSTEEVEETLSNELPMPLINETLEAIEKSQQKEEEASGVILSGEELSEKEIEEGFSNEQSVNKKLDETSETIEKLQKEEEASKKQMTNNALEEKTIQSHSLYQKETRELDNKDFTREEMEFLASEEKESHLRKQSKKRKLVFLAFLVFIAIGGYAFIVWGDKIQWGKKRPSSSPPILSEWKIVDLEWGDTLAKIAHREYGNKIMWPYLYFENSNTIYSPFKLIPIKDKVFVKYQTNQDLGWLYFELFKMYRDKTVDAEFCLIRAYQLNPDLVYRNIEQISPDHKKLLEVDVNSKTDDTN